MLISRFNILTSIKNKVAFNCIIRLLIQSYMIVAIASLLNVTHPNFDTPSMAASYAFAFLASVFVMLSPFGIFIFLNFEFENIKNSNTHNNVSSLF